MTDRLPLHNQVVVLCGRLISMSHADAADLIASRGGRFARRVSRATTIVVVGDDGLPLGSDGTPDPRLARAQELIADDVAIEILCETDFLSRAMHDDDDAIHRAYTLAELIQIVGIPARVIRGWLRQGLLAPTRVVAGLQYFDFAHVSRLRTLAELAANGISAKRIRAGLEQLGQWLSDDRPIELLNAVESHKRRLVVRLKDGRLAETRGQLLFDFESDNNNSVVLGLPTTPLLERALAYEEEGDLELAATVYREILDRGDEEPETRFNFANVAYSLGWLDEAIELFEQALDRDAEYVEAWNNLGSALLDIGRDHDAISAFRRALRLRPAYADAHFNLATTLEENGKPDDAREHWVAYLNLSENARRSTRVRTRRKTAKHHADDEAENSVILRFDAHR